MPISKKPYRVAMSHDQHGAVFYQGLCGKCAWMGTIFRLPPTPVSDLFPTLTAEWSEHNTRAIESANEEAEEHVGQEHAHMWRR